ncbi:PLP-dependent aminotransferase family protein [Variovorax sp. J22R133]|uniref:MocR-like pyridoxine biosynthesis transcription factor PdxR n=1 Tax=Variovorax brevis TaxID=3053503 RepID=UPI002574B705|nr:PLP-dependent aminotransferase family protein [Variovorax sp. J22R133]MDM0111600.1 PLP-dependent aminotransferase family protein [Variovorax sp. J22R133]
MAQHLKDVMWKQLLQRSARENMSLQGQIREMLVAAILDGQLPAGVPIPSSREMAEQLGVARNTVVLAYQQLADEGYLVSRQRSGHFVNTDMVAQRLGLRSRPTQDDTKATDWAGRFRLRPSQQRSIVKPSDWQKYPHPFLYGQFDAALFPTADWRECCIKSLSVLDIRDWAPDQISRDDESLVQQIRTRVLPRRGVWASADEIVITVGAQHALYMIADLLVREGTRVGMEEPGYPDARNIFASRTSQLMPLAVDAEGLPVTEALRDLDFVYTTPNHQCPSTVTMPLERREALLKMADDADFIIIEDDYESENRFDGEPIPALKSLDRSNRVIYVGSLSKTLAPGLRMGYVVGPAELIAELRALRRLMLRHPPALIQRAFALFLSLGHYDALQRRLTTAQRERSDLLRAALAQYMPQCTVMPASGGGSCWVSLPQRFDASELAAQARERGVLIEPGEVFFMADPRPQQHFRMGYSSIVPAAIEPGVKLLAELVRGFEHKR